MTSSSSSATFLFGPNYDTHVPNRNVVSIVGVEEGAGMTGGSGYVLQMPFVYGTVVGYSPPPSAMEADDDDDDDDDDEDGGEFPAKRRREDVALFRILWDGHSTSSGAGYVEDVTGPELVSCLLVGGHGGDSRKKRRAPPPPSSSSTMSSMSETAHAIARHVHATTARRQLALEWRVECSILPRLVVVAALERLNQYMPGFVPPTPPPHDKDDANDYK